MTDTPEERDNPARTRYAGPNEAWASEIAAGYQARPSEVPSEDQELWQRWHATSPAAVPENPLDLGTLDAVHAVVARIRDIRHARYRTARASQVGPSDTENAPAPVPPVWNALDLDVVNRLLTVPAQGRTVADALDRLDRLYGGSASIQVEHVRDIAIRDWWWRAFEAGPTPLAPDTARSVLRQLTQVEQFEQFFHTRFPGQKRFSAEGLDMVVPVLNAWIDLAGATGQDRVVMGMAHRGRLSVLAYVMGKPLAALIQEMQMVTTRATEPVTADEGWTGDAKYHLGWQAARDAHANRPPVDLLNNPSHLEFVNPVVEGAARALQEDRGRPGKPHVDGARILPILVHGDAAFIGEGVSSETLNLACLPAYTTGGTLHLMLDNGLGFTTDPEDGRSTLFSSDLVRGFDVPVLHAAADHPDAALWLAQLAHQYRSQFGRDVLLILHGYRRWGHNEGDDPGFTQPVLYDWIGQHPPVRELWANELAASQIIRAGDADDMVREERGRLEQGETEATAAPLAPDAPGITKPVGSTRARDWSEDDLRALVRELTTPPPGFTPYPRLRRLLDRWQAGFEQDAKVDWGMAESLAFATLLREGVAIRLSGQDTERGTFSQRHAVWHDGHDGHVHVPLAELSESRAALTLTNSPLSEAACLGFEFGYDAYSADTLVLWEAQFGDFANSGQVIIDQFLASSHAKWHQDSGLVLLLPHGYDGQGPEHSSARLERFLALSANLNWRVTYPTTGAQYFHLLRRHARGETIHPLVVLTAKSLFRHRASRAFLGELTQGAFQPVLLKAEPERPDTVRSVVLGTGKVLVDLVETGLPPSVAVVALEQVYPWPVDPLRQALDRYPHCERLTVLQEEPANMGALSFVLTALDQMGLNLPIKVVARPASGTPAEGFLPLHTTRQALLLEEALAPRPARGRPSARPRKSAATPPTGKGQ